MQRGLDWYKREPQAIIDAIRAAKMSTRQAAIYNLIIDLSYVGAGKTPDDPDYIAAHFSDVGAAAARNTINDLIAMGKLRSEDGFLIQKRCENEAETRKNLSKTRADAGRLGGVSSGFSRRQSNENNDLFEAHASSKHQAEKRREEKIKKGSPLEPPKKGSRLSENWQPNEKDFNYAIAHNLNAAETLNEAEKFRNHWISSDGPNAIQRDWSAKWRNWILHRNEINGAQKREGPSALMLGFAAAAAKRKKRT